MSFKVVFNNNVQRYAEVGQVRPCLFSFAVVDPKKEGVVLQQHSWIKCRDFLNDTLVWKAQMKDLGKVLDNGRYYGYDFKGDIDENNTRFVMTNIGGLVDNVPLLNKIETEAGYEPTKVSLDETGKIAMTVGDKRWMDNTVASSFYTYLLRMFTYGKMSKVEELFKTNDPWINNNPVKPIFLKMPKAIKALPKKNVRGSTNNSMHDFNGFMTALQSPQYNIYGEDLKNALSKL